MRAHHAILAVVLAVQAIATSPSLSAAELNDSVKIDIAAQPLDTALLKFSEQTGIQVLAAADAMRGKATAGVHGQYSVEKALTELLKGSGLAFRQTSAHAVTIAAPRTSKTSEHTAQPSDNKTDGDGNTKNINVPLLVPAPSETEKTKLQEIVVTAQKREERLQDVPVPVTAVSAQTLVDNNQPRLQDYYTMIPGLSVTPGDFHGSPMLSIRGITTGGGFLQPTVGVVVDDIPYGSSTGIGGGFQSPDIDPSDLARVEVLRGPQGTLYGASSIGGLLKYVTVDPSTDHVSGRVQAGVSSVHNGDGAGGNLRGVVNVPLSDTLAIRVSGFARRDPGYIDNVRTGERGVNQADAEGGRIAALWRPSDVWSVKLTASYQHTEVDGSPVVDVQPGLGDLQQDTLPKTGNYTTSFQAYDATVTAKLGGLDLTSLTGYNVNSYSDSVDFTPAFAAATRARFGVPGTPLHDRNKTRKFTQEFRLSNPVGERLEWLVGAFYTHEDSLLVQDILAADAAGTVIGLWNDSAPPTTFAEYAAFADLTYHFTDRFDVQVGGRESKNRQTYNNTDTGPYATQFLHLATDPFVFPEVITKDNSFTYLVTPRFRLSPNFMAYARLASGYRPGGPNSNAVVFGTPPAFKPDKTQNYEVGAKGDLFEHLLSFDASVYYIDWKDIQLNLTDPVTKAGYRSNASRAKSEGVELSVQMRPLTGMSIDAWAAYNDAELTEALPKITNAYGAPGDRLPYSSRVSGNLSFQQEFPLTGSVVGFAGASVSYVGDRKGVFRAVPLRQTFPAYAQTDLRIGARYESWTINGSVTNVADQRGVLTGGLGTSPDPLAFNYIQPRTVGASVSRSF